MLSWIVRILLALAAPIAALFVSRDALNFGTMQTMISIILIAAFVALVAMWPRRPRSPS
jgi:hypothetical protein